MRARQTSWSRKTTDLLWAGDSLLVEVNGSTSVPTYRLLDHEGSLALATDSAGNVLGTNVLTPYGQNMYEQLSDAYTWTGLFQDTEYSGQAAWYRDYSARAARWLTPDPYNGSYNTYRPQSFNRYMYVMGDPLGSVDPSGEAGAGILTEIGGAKPPRKLWGVTSLIVSKWICGLSRTKDSYFIQPSFDICIVVAMASCGLPTKLQRVMPSGFAERTLDQIAQGEDKDEKKS